MKKPLLAAALCVAFAWLAVSPASQSFASTNNAPGYDGQIISMTPINVKNANPQMMTYKMMYWSARTKTEAFVAVPDGPGPYPLYVRCHGGSFVPTADQHFPSPMGAKDLATAFPPFITLIPEYRGYADSDGTVQGLYGDTLDTDNAIRAIMHRYPVEPNHIYLVGTSMGGGVVLKLAAERNDIRSVIAISPFVGWDIIGQWSLKHRSNSKQAWIYYRNMMDHFGPYDPGSPTFARESIDYSDIHAPTLLLQGTGDPVVPWRTVQTFYDDMKASGGNVKLVLFPGGGYRLQGKYQLQVDQEIDQWYLQYGETSY